MCWKHILEWGSDSKTVVLSHLNRNTSTSASGAGRLPSHNAEQYTDIAPHVLEYPARYCRVRLGGGGYGAVYLYKKRKCLARGEKRAIKVMEFKNKRRRELKDIIKAEINLHKQLSHDNVIQYYGTYSAVNHICIIMEYADQGSLSDHLEDLHKEKKALTEDKILNLTSQLLKGLDYLHTRPKPIIHSDLKSLNTLLCGTKDKIKLADFGVSRHLNTVLSSNSKFSSGYWMAPELLVDDQGKFGIKNDIWSLGIVIQEMIWTTQVPIFKISVAQYPIKLIKDKELPLTIPLSVSSRLTAVLKACLVYEPADRGTAKKVLDIVEGKIAGDAHEPESIINIQVKYQPGAEEEGRDELSSTLPSYHSPDRRKEGICLVLHNIHFTDPSYNTRAGAEWDKLSVEKVFRDKLGFSFEHHQNKSKDDVMDLLEQFVSNGKLKEYKCCVVIVMSHGQSESFVCSDGSKLSYGDLFRKFNGDKCPGLAGVPKWFIIQACRTVKNKAESEAFNKSVNLHDGEEASVRELVDKKISSERELVDKEEASVCELVDKKISSVCELVDKKISIEEASVCELSIPACPDFFLSYSTAPGYYSYRDPRKGSWFIQTLCSIVEQYATREDVANMMTRVNKTVALEYVHTEHVHRTMYERSRDVEVRQMPSHVHMLTGAFFLCSEARLRRYLDIPIKSDIV